MPRRGPGQEIERPKVKPGISPFIADPEHGFVRFNAKASQFQGDKPPTRLMEDFCRLISSPTRPRKLVILAFRGFSKSTTVARYVAWRLYLNQQYKAAVASKTLPFAKKWTKMVLDLIYRMEMLQHLIPGSNKATHDKEKQEKQRESVVAFEVAGAKVSVHPSVSAFGLGGQTTGSRGIDLIGDDVETPENTRTASGRDMLYEQVTEFSNLGIIGEDVSELFIGTPHHDESVYPKLVKEGFTLVIYPLCYPDAKEMEIIGEWLAPILRADLARDPSLAGKPTDPDRVTPDYVEEKKRKKRNYLRQYQCLFRIPDLYKRPLRLSDLSVMSLEAGYGPDKVQWTNEGAYAIAELPSVGFHGDRWYKPIEVDAKYRAYEDTVMSLDLARGGGDEFAYSIVARVNGTLFLLDAGRMEGGWRRESNLVGIAQKAIRWKVNLIHDETTGAQELFRQLLAPVLARECKAAGWRCGFTEKGFTSTTNKARRMADILSQVMGQHRLVVNRPIIDSDYRYERPGFGIEESAECQLFYQMVHLDPDDPKDGGLEYDDCLDSLAMACLYHAPALGLDREERAKRYAEEEGWRETESFLAEVEKLEPNLPGNSRNHPPSALEWVRTLREHR